MNTRHLVRAVTLLLTGAFAAWLIVALIAGKPGELMSAVQPGQPRSQGQLFFPGPYLPALFPLFALSIIVVGLLLSFLHEKMLFISWIGLFMLFATAALLFWSIGVSIAIYALLLSIPLAITHWRITNNKLWIHMAWAGVALLLISRFVLYGTPSSQLPFFAFVGYTILLSVLEWRLARPQAA